MARAEPRSRRRRHHGSPRTAMLPGASPRRAERPPVLYSLMPTPILGTKLFAPRPRPDDVRRPHLTDRLREGFHRKLTLVSAPAGFGKTTVVGDAIAGCGRPAAWLSLDSADSDLRRFLAHLVAALKTVAPSVGDGIVAALEARHLPGTPPLLTSLLNDITAMDPHVLVLDDYHAVDSPDVDTALAFVVDHLPPQSHLVIASREDPPLALARLRVRGQLTELRAADLRFRPEEAAHFLNETMGLSLSPDLVSALEVRTEGWIAGLQMAALSMQGRDDPSAFIETFTGSHRFVLDYLVDEVLQQQNEHVRSFLLRTSILDRLCGPLCDAVTADPAGSGQETLEFLERANLLLVPLDGSRQWYRYHHLFADVLRSMLQRERPAEAPNLHRRASLWYERNDLTAKAVGHAFAAEDYTRAADLVEASWGAMDRTYQSGTWLGWAKSLPYDLVRERPWLGAGYAWALLDAGAMEAAEPHLVDVEHWLAAQAPEGAAGKDTDRGEEVRLLAITVANGRAYHANAVGDASAAAMHARRALELLPESEHFERALAALLLGCAQWSIGGLEDARSTLAEAAATMWLSNNVPFAISFTSYLADIVVAQGRLGEATRICQDAIERARLQADGVLDETAVLHLCLCEIHHERREDGAAQEHMAVSAARGELVTFPSWYRRWPHARARLAVAARDLDQALEALADGERLFYRHSVPDVRPLSAMKARVWIEQGRLPEAGAWASERRLSIDDDLTYLREYEHITLARLLVAKTRRDRVPDAARGALALLARLLQAAEAGGRSGSVIEILVLQTIAHAALGDSGAARATLEQALTLAEPEGWVRPFTDEGEAMVRLVSAVDPRGPTAAHADRVLEAARVQPQTRPTRGAPHTAGRAPSNLAEPLSERELEVLQLIALGLSNREIGDRLFRALDTIKGYTRTLYGKLRVRSRTEAVARARELGVLDN